MPATIKLDATQTTDIEKAASLLLAGHLVAMPTETVYGLAADASNEQAVRKVFEAKQRPVGHPLIVHVASPERIRYWVDRVPEAAEKLINTFWPGPLTLLLPKKSDVSDFITGGNPGVAVRMPAHTATVAKCQMRHKNMQGIRAFAVAHVNSTASRQHPRQPVLFNMARG